MAKPTLNMVGSLAATGTRETQSLERLPMTERDTKIALLYHCRGCGRELPPSKRSLFHPDCLKVDKRRRVQEVRRRERIRFERWLSRQRCPQCGAELGTLAHPPRPTAQPPREASQGAVERSPDHEKAVDAGRRLGPRIGQNDREMEGGK
jgi:hypothetical protein